MLNDAQVLFFTDTKLKTVQNPYGSYVRFQQYDGSSPMNQAAVTEHRRAVYKMCLDGKYISFSIEDETLDKLVAGLIEERNNQNLYVASLQTKIKDLKQDAEIARQVKVLKAIYMERLVEYTKLPWYKRIFKFE